MAAGRSKGEHDELPLAATSAEGPGVPVGEMTHHDGDGWKRVEAAMPPMIRPNRRSQTLPASAITT